ncbi:membrane protein insertion efficiency factor YidD [Myxococcus fulvus]|uniref:membrane protein insertion efficiency factor YidD n=2 Tax=Myxococcus TaxID=32 RepID=UPI0011421571|nr:MULTISPECIES: membrane protein insertion efficiency factor YidD [Myxococcus]MCK8501491.1 membrane protein insertion efficiency factor YidD [Myxococcus fulvus]
MTPSPHSQSNPWEGNEYSALARFPPPVRSSPDSASPPASRWHWWLNPLAWLVVGLILLYRHLLPNAWKRHCIYTPTCSLYGLRSIQRYGVARGSARTWARIRRCNGALYLGGVDEP